MFPLILLKRKENRCEIFLSVCISRWVPETQSGVSFFPMLRRLVSKQDWLNIHSHCIYCDPVKTTKIAVRCSLVSVYLVLETQAQVSFPALCWLQNFKTRLTQHLAPFWPVVNTSGWICLFCHRASYLQLFTSSIIYCAEAEQEMLQWPQPR